MSFTRTIASSVTRAAPKLRVAGVSINTRTFVNTAVKAAPSLTEAITDDHRKLHQYYNEIVNSSDNEHKERWGNQFIWELARHSVAEEIIVYPSMEHYMPHGKGRAHAEKDRKQHHELKVMLKDFQNLRAGDPEYIPQLKRLYSHLEEHIKEEESDDLPALEKALAGPDNAGSSEQLAKSFSRTKAIAPSRSHPAAGENPNVEATAGLPIAIFDHIADLFRKYPEGKVSPNPSTK